LLIEALAQQPPCPTEAEVLVIGAGAVGLALALELARKGVQVTVLEAGGATPRPDFATANRGPSTGKDHRGLENGRMKALGGTTRLWGGQLVPFDALDLEGGTFPGHQAWPIAYEELKPYFKRAFEFLGVPESGQDQDAIWKRATDSPSAFGQRLNLGMNIWLPQPDFVQMFGKEIRDLECLRVVTHAEAKQILFAEDDARACGVEVRTPTGGRMRFSGDTVVLANGTFEISGLLLRTAALQPGSPLAGNVNLGRWYIDHFHGNAGTIRITDRSGAAKLFDHVYHQGRKYSVKVRAGEPLRRERRISNCAGFVNPRFSIGRSVADLMALGRRLTHPGVVRALVPAVRDIIAMTRVLIPVIWRYLVERRSSVIVRHGLDLAIELEQIPTEKSYIFLDSAAPPEEAPVGVHWGFDGREVDAAAAYCAEFKREFEQRGLGSVEIDAKVIDRDPAFLDACHDSNHQMGGARMAKDAESGVVDSNLLAFGTENLYVVGPAVFPSGSFANPTLTALALALRLADRVAAGVGHAAR
jgi:choline dehydrogenase-like flavoprotein